MSNDLPIATSHGNKPLCSSIMAHPVTERKIEIQGSYWPRLLLRKEESTSGKRDAKKAHKTKRTLKKYNSYPSSLKLHLSESSPTSLLDLLQDVPLLLSEEDHATSRSPVTGKLILSPKHKGSLLIPSKPLRKHLERRSQSKDSSYSHD